MAGEVSQVETRPRRK